MIRLTSMLLTLLTAAAIATGAAAGLTEVRLKRDIIISGANIRLGDLFENAGLLANKIVGKAPAPGARTVYGSRQVSALARANGLVWRPRGRQPFIAVRRAGRRVPREVVLRELGQALIDAGAGEGLQIELANRDLALYSAEHETAAVAVDIFDFDPRTARFRARIWLVGNNEENGIDVSGRAHRVIEVPVLRIPIAVNATIDGSDVEYRKIRRERLAADTVADARDVVGMAAKRRLRAGVPLRAGDLRVPVMVAKGALVTITYEAPGLQLSATARALENGGDGALIRVSNLHSKRTVEAIVISPTLVRVQ